MLVGQCGVFNLFLGAYKPVLDDKNRLAIPARLRKVGNSDLSIASLIILPGCDGCIMGFKYDDWENFVKDKILALSQSDPENRKKVRFILSGAVECELDRQGRVVIPGSLKDYASIDKEVVVIGVYDRIEIWASGVYEKYIEEGSGKELISGNFGF
jgi:MraZ protein